MFVNVIYGFLGSGKTTLIRHLLEHPPSDEKIVVFVNEFGEVGVDGLSISGSGGLVADVVELPSGCICCTMASDFRRQFLEVHEVYRPDRMIIEPTGVATISQILQILEGEDLQPLYSRLSLIHMVDASEFLSFIKVQRHFMENQLRSSRTIVLNKMDRVEDRRLDLLVSSIKEINPDAFIYPTSFSRLDEKILDDLFKGSLGEHEVYRSPEATSASTHSESEEHEHHDSFVDQFESFGKTFANTFLRPRIDDFFRRLLGTEFGDVVRAKGIFKTDENWMKWELASGEVTTEAVSGKNESVVSVIGHGINPNRMDDALNHCKV